MDISSTMDETGAVLKGHFQLTSGRHSDTYLEKFRLLERPEIVEEMGKQMAKAVKGIDVDVVLGAAVGGILISSATANALGKKGFLQRGWMVSSNYVEDLSLLRANRYWWWKI